MLRKTVSLVLLLVLSGSFSALAREHRPLLESAGETKEQLPMRKTLQQAMAERPFPEYAKWWTIGKEFATFMSEAIFSEWTALPGNDGNLRPVSLYATEYLKTVYAREAKPLLVEDFVMKDPPRPLQSGEFDALSYAFFRSAFELMEQRKDASELPLETRRRLFTKRVGKRFFARLADHLGLELPAGLEDEPSFAALKASIAKVGSFLKEQGYFRDHVAFRFDVAVEHKGRKLTQAESQFLERLRSEGAAAYGLFEMGYPVILPSAVYLFNTLGEAQHHSSRTMEELFDRVGYAASETEGFDPTGYPSDMVVELWEIRKKR